MGINGGTYNVRLVYNTSIRHINPIVSHEIRLSNKICNQQDIIII